MISASTNCAVLLATAKQMPCAPAMTAVLMPITSPPDDTSGPPELPGFSAASVWITSSIIRPPIERIERPSAHPPAPPGLPGVPRPTGLAPAPVPPPADRADRAAERRHHAGRDGGFKAE